MALTNGFQDVATEASLQDILAKLITTPATAAGQEAQRLLLTQIAAALTTEGGYLDGVEGLLTAIGNALAGILKVSATTLPLPTGAATDARQATGNTSLAAIVTALGATLAVLPVIKPWAAWAPATAIDMRNYAGVEIQVTGAGTATFTRSADDATYAAVIATASGVAASSPLAVGFYNLKGGGWLKFAGAAAITVRGYN